jgi:Trp operon repressor
MTHCHYIMRQRAQEHNHLLRIVPILVPLRQPKVLLALFNLDLDERQKLGQRLDDALVSA